MSEPKSKEAPVAAFLETLRGVRIGGRYVVENVLGTGGMGVVVSARYPDLDQRVAVKLLRPGLGDSKSSGARFLREAKISANVESPHLVRVFDVGRLEAGTPYMVMELLSGHDLREELRRKGPMPIEDAVDVVLQACVGLAQVHANSIVHRDLKPSNLFLSIGRGNARTVKILDFGISKQTSADDARSLTATEQVLGSPQYMSPEQIKDARKTDARTDVWSLGVILYEMLTGKGPFKLEGDGVGELFGVIMFTDPIAPSAARPEIPPALEDVILRCLKRDREERYASVGELAAALAPFAGSSSQHRVDEVRRALASLRPPPNVTDDNLDDLPDLAVATTGAQPSLRRSWTLAIGTGVVVSAIAATMLLAPRERASTSDLPAVGASAPLPLATQATAATSGAVSSTAAPSALAAEPTPAVSAVQRPDAARAHAAPSAKRASATSSAAPVPPPAPTGRDRGI